MPVSYQFIRTSDGQPASLAEVQLEMCEASGVDDHPTQNCQLYDFILMTGMAICQRGDGFTTSQEAFDRFRAEDPTKFEERIWEWIHRFCVQDYTYSCWR